MRSAEAIRSFFVIAEERGIMVGARETRLLMRDVRPVMEKGVDDRGSCISGDVGEFARLS